MRVAAKKFDILGRESDILPADYIFSYRSSFHPGASSLSDGAAGGCGETGLSVWGRPTAQDLLAFQQSRWVTSTVKRGQLFLQIKMS